jgi:hypothetical protein
VDDVLLGWSSYSQARLGVYPALTRHHVYSAGLSCDFKNAFEIMIIFVSFYA